MSPAAADGTYGVGDFLAAARLHEKSLADELQRVRERLARHRAARAEVASRTEAALEELLAALLPELTAPALDRLEAWTGFSAFRRDDPLAARERDRDRVKASLAALESEPEWVGRGELLHPVTGPLVLARDELLRERAPLDELLAKADHPRLATLIENGYGTEAYAIPWWRTAYYADWQAGDEILERFPDRETFGELRAILLDVREAHEELTRRVEESKARIAAVEGLEQEHARLEEELRGLDARHLAEARTRLRPFLEDGGLEGQDERLAGAREVGLVARRWAGLVRQGRYLDELSRVQLEPLEADLLAQQRKLRHDLVKFQRPKKAGTRFPADKFERRFRDRGPRFERHWKRYDQGFESVSNFDRWERGSLAADFLWWDLMTDGRVDGRFIPEVSRFHERHPGYRWERSPDEDLSSAAAAAVALSDGDAGRDDGTWQDAS